MSGTIPELVYSHTDKDGIAVYAVAPNLPSIAIKREPETKLTTGHMFGIGFSLVFSILNLALGR